jgi:chromosomal replication initiation ATPase DnaA
MTKFLRSTVGTPIIKSLYNEVELDFNEYFIAGSRTSGKTHTACELITILGNFITKSGKELKVDTYYFRNHKTLALES